MTTHIRTFSAAILVLALSATAAWCGGQPFAANGLGLIVDDNSGRSRGMGGAGVASTDGVNMLRSNPALLTTFARPMYDISMLYNRSSTDTGTETSSFEQIDPTLIRFAVPLREKLFIGFNIAPYTRSDCEIVMPGTFSNSDTTITYTDTMSSSGGVNVTTLELATKIRSVSIGAAIDYYFGSTNEEWARTFDAADSLTNTTQYISKQYSGYGATFGVLVPLPNNTTVGLGYTTAVGLDSKKYVRAGNESYDERQAGTSTVHLPAKWRMGVSSKLSSRVSTSADYSFAGWSDAARTATEKKMYNDAYSIAAGVRYVPRESMGSGYFSRIPLSAGVRTGTLYYKSYSTDASKIKPIQETAVTLGAEFPFQDGNGGLITSFELGKRGDESRNGWSETFIQVGISLTGGIK